MTGAPKRRTVQILNTLESGPRGPYSGTLGFFSIHGPSEFSVIIRTVILEEKVESQSTKLNISVGAGGAVVILSDPEEEWKEMLLKGRSVFGSIEETFHLM